MEKLVFVTGASGSGKTTALKRLENDDHGITDFYYFDSVGVPSPEEMVSEYGSGENWQRAMALQWVKQIKQTNLEKRPAILDGQMKIAFIQEACDESGVGNYQIILVDCDGQTRKERLMSRGHPELANDDMISWAQYLRSEAESVENAYILDNSTLNVEETASKIRQSLSGQ